MPVQTEQSEIKTVYEDLLTGGNPDDPTNPFGASTIATGTLASLVSVGADEPVTFSLSLADATLPTVTSKGEAVVYDLDGNLLTAYVDSGTTAGEFDAGDRPVFTLEITNTATGAYTFTLLDQLDHSGEDDDQDLLDLDFSSIIVATDADDDSIMLDNAFTIQVENDVPVQVDISLTFDETLGTANEGVADVSDDVATAPLPFALPDSGSVALNVAMVTTATSFGADGAANDNPIRLVLGTQGAESTLMATGTFGVVDTGGDQRRPIYLYQIDAVTIVGVMAVLSFNAWVNPDSVDDTLIAIDGTTGFATIDFTGVETAFTVVLDPAGDFSSVDTYFVEHVAIWHDDQGDPEETDDNGTLGADAAPTDSPFPVSQTQAFTIQLTDGDGDTDSAVVTVTVEDDGHVALGDVDVIGLSGIFETFDNFEDLNASAYRSSGGFNINNSFGGTDGATAAEATSNGTSLANLQAFFGDGGASLADIVAGFKLSTGASASLTNLSGGTGFESVSHVLTTGDTLSFDWAFRTSEPSTGFDNDYAFWSLYKVTSGSIAADGTVDAGATYQFVSAGLIFDVNALYSNNLDGFGGYLRVDSDGDGAVDHPAETFGGSPTTGWEFGLPFSPTGLAWVNNNPDVKTVQSKDITIDASFEEHGDVDPNDGQYLISVPSDGTYVLRFGVIDIQAGSGGSQPSELNIDRIRIQEIVDLDSSGDVFAGTTDEGSSGGADQQSVDGSRVSVVAYDLDHDGLIEDGAGATDEVLALSIGGSASFSAWFGDFTINSDGSYTYDAHVNTDTELAAVFPDATVYDEGFLYTAIDGDGDTSSALLTIRIDANGGDNSGVDNYVGSMFDDTFDAGVGNDFLSGRGGDDVLIGGLGSDEMTGGLGADTFVVSGDTLGVGIADIIADYDRSENDVVDLTELLGGLGLTNANDLDVEGYVTIDHVSGNQYTISVDQDGSAANASTPEIVANITVEGAPTTLTILFDDSQPAQDVNI